jgi:acyl-CoA dehydrogenase
LKLDWLLTLAIVDGEGTTRNAPRRYRPAVLSNAAEDAAVKGVTMVVDVQTPTAGFRPAPLHPDDDRFVELAGELSQAFAERAAAHDRDNTFVSENYVEMTQRGYTMLAVPEELGGMGASIRQVCYAQAELAKGCGSTALAIAMHQYSVLAQVWRLKHGAADAERVLRRVTQDKIILMTSGGSDGIWPSGTATRVDGGYRVNARKVFCSQAPIADIISTMARLDDPDAEPSVLLMGVVLASEGVELVETWDTLGMRATGSHDLRFTDVFVSDAQVLARRPWGRNDPALRNALVHFAPVVASVYWGIAAGARDVAVAAIHDRVVRHDAVAIDDQLTIRRIGEIDATLRTTWWTLLGALEELGDDYHPDARATNLVTIAKREVVTRAIRIVDLAMETVGGAAFFKTSPLERAYRDVRGGPFHPLTPEKTLIHAGRMTLGIDVDQVW